MDGCGRIKVGDAHDELLIHGKCFLRDPVIRILHSTLSFESGGRREAIRTLARGQQALGVSSDLCCVSHLGCDESVLGTTFSRHIVLARRGMFDRGAIGKLRQFCIEREIDVIHAHDAASQAMAACVRLRLPRVKALMTFHRSLSFESATIGDKLRNAVATAACGAVVCGSRERREHFVRENLVAKWKMVRIPFGIDLERFGPDQAARHTIRDELGIDDDTFVFGAAGHFGQEKGIDIAIRAFGEFLRQVQPEMKARLVVLGSGRPNEQKAIDRLIAEIGDGRIIPVGFRRDVERWFNAMDCFVHVPRQEAFGLVLAEAMATRLPVIASSVGGIPDIVRPGVNGLLVNPEDIAGIAAAMLTVCGKRDLREQLAAGAIAVAQNDYSSERYAVDYLRLYEDLLAGRPPRGVDESGVVNDSTAAIVSRNLKSISMMS